MELNQSHIDFIVKDVQKRGVVYEPLESEIVDHICTLVEARMDDGMRFMEAYLEVIASFGGEKQLRAVQKSTIELANHKVSIMVKNYIKIAFRNLSKHKFYSAVNILGLTIGVTCCLLILLFVSDELGYDKHWTNSDRIYRVSGDHLFHGEPFYAAITPAPLAQALANDFPEVQSSARFRNAYGVIFNQGELVFNEPNVFFADSSIFQVFDFNLLVGNADQALTQPQTMVISSAIAEKYFDQEDPVGKYLTTSGGTQYTISGIFEPLPSNTHFQVDILLSMASFSRANNNAWLSNNFHTYILLQEGSSPEELESKFPQMVAKYVEPALNHFGASLNAEGENPTRVKYFLQPVVDIHLKSDLVVELAPNSDITYVYLFTSIAVFILVIAGINYMNLSTARSAERAKEVGVRKVLGSYRSHLIKQFLTESILLSSFAFLLAIIAAWLIMPYFNSLSQKSLVLPTDDLTFWLLMGVGVVLVGAGSGVYPAFYLSSFKPIKVIKGVFKAGTGTAWLRSFLVVFQFGISILLIVGTGVIYGQLNYIQNKKLGFNKEQTLLVHDAYLLGNQSAAYKSAIKAQSAVVNASYSGYLPVRSSRSDTNFSPQGNSDPEASINMQYWRVDYDYIPTMEMEVVKGRNFSEEFPSDLNLAMIINESAAEAFGFDDPIGQVVEQPYWNPSTGSVDHDSLIASTIIGVVKDFHFNSLRENIGNLSMVLGTNRAILSVRFNSDNASEVLEAAEREWKNIDASQPFSYSFLDQRFSNMYAAEQRTGTIFALFAAFAILVACLGLFALASFTTEQRIKEIGIRKVMGASVSSIVLLLSSQFSRLILFSFLITIPIAIYGVEQWLEQFAYSFSAGPSIYLSAGLLAFLVAMFTLSYQSIKAARSNPAKSLRTE